MIEDTILGLAYPLSPLDSKSTGFILVFGTLYNSNMAPSHQKSFQKKFHKEWSSVSVCFTSSRCKSHIEYIIVFDKTGL